MMPCLDVLLYNVTSVEVPAKYSAAQSRGFV